MSDIAITVGELAFSFRNLAHWIDEAQAIWKRHHLRGDESICVDQKGRVCKSGREFLRAEKDDAYPINVYRLER